MITGGKAGAMDFRLELLRRVSERRLPSFLTSIGGIQTQAMILPINNTNATTTTIVLIIIIIDIGLVSFNYSG